MKRINRCNICGGRTHFETCVTCLPKNKRNKHKILIQLQSELKDMLFVRPYDIEAIECAAIKLCDAIIENHEG